MTVIQGSEKKQDPLKIVLSCEEANNKDTQKMFNFIFKISRNNFERCMNKKKMKNEKYRNLKIFPSDII